MSVALLVATFAASAADPQYITQIAQKGFLTSQDVTPPEATLVAGPRFLDLVADSRKELCEIELSYLAATKQGVTRVRIVNAAGQVLLTCGE